MSLRKKVGIIASVVAMAFIGLMIVCFMLLPPGFFKLTRYDTGRDTHLVVGDGYYQVVRIGRMYGFHNHDNEEGLMNVKGWRYWGRYFLVLGDGYGLSSDHDNALFVVNVDNNDFRKYYTPADCPEGLREQYLDLIEKAKSP
jgi:hypothetical protein